MATTPSEAALALRSLAEKQADLMPEIPEAVTPEEMGRVLHELRVHQIEMEMQNEELRRIQVELEASRERYFDLYDLAPVGYVSLGETGVILEANLAAATLLGVVRGALVNQPLAHFILSEDQDLFYHLRIQLIATGTPQVCELRLVKQDAGPLWVRLEAAVARAGDDSGACRVVVSDITGLQIAEEERLELERRLLHSQKLESLGVLAGGIAHDFNNLLMAIMGNMDMALLALPQESPARPWLNQSVQAATHAAKLTRQMLAYSGKGTFVVERLNLSRLVSENAHLLKAALVGTVTINLDLPEKLPFIMADVGQIQQVVMNPITNAAEACGEKPGVLMHCSVQLKCIPPIWPPTS